MKKIVALIAISVCLTLFLSGCYNSERRARNLNYTFANLFLDGPGVN